ncbi:hypothetical protein BD413DRAFT_17516 [Trametes elegans]|nr:hypothetical protein BD413DRAFT_17516 [Trametes elegans]
MSTEVASSSGIVFPLEVWGYMFRCVSGPQDLAHLARACASLREDAETALYRDVVIHSEARVLRFCETVAQCPRRASNVKTLAIRLDHPSSSDPCEGVTSISQALVKALRALAHLQHLTLKIDSRETVSACLQQDILNVHWPELRRFSTNLPVHRNVLRYLEANAQVEALTLVGKHPELEWSTPPSDPLLQLPKLRELVCENPLLPHLAPSRHLSDLTMPQYLLHSLPTIAQLFGKTLVTLRLGRQKMMLGRPGPGWTFNDVAVHFPKLRILHINDHQKSTSPLIGRGFNPDPDATFLPSGTFTPLTVIWTAEWSTPDRDNAEYIRDTITPEASRLLQQWTPYLRRLVFWFRDSRDATYTSFVLGNAGSLVVGH